MKAKKILLPFAVIAVTFVLVWLIFSTKPEARKFKQAPSHKLITDVMKPQPEIYPVWVPSYGIIQPKTQSLMIAQVSGQVLSVSEQFRDGAFFEQGDVLLTIDDADYQAQLTIALAELKQAEFTHQDEVARSTQALKDWKKLGNKNKPPSLVAREPQLNSSLSNLEASRAKVLQAQLNLKRSKIIAPFAGRVLNLDVNVGQVVNNGTTLGSIYAVDSVEVRLPLKASDLAHLSLPERYRGQSRIGQSHSDQSSRNIAGDPAAISVKLFAEIGKKKHQWLGQLVRVEGTIDAQTRQVYVVVSIEDPYQFREDGTPPLKVGQFVNAFIQGNDLTNVVVLPRAAVASGNFINVIEAGVLTRHIITPLWEDDNHVVIDYAFQPSQSIGITPLGDVISGTEVAVTTKGDNAQGVDNKKGQTGKKGQNGKANKGKGQRTGQVKKNKSDATGPSS